MKSKIVYLYFLFAILLVLLNSCWGTSFDLVFYNDTVSEKILWIYVSSRRDTVMFDNSFIKLIVENYRPDRDHHIPPSSYFVSHQWFEERNYFFVEFLVIDIDTLNKYTSDEIIMNKYYDCFKMTDDQMKRRNYIIHYPLKGHR